MTSKFIGKKHIRPLKSKHNDDQEHLFKIELSESEEFEEKISF
jgi:hypothetical protein